MWNQEVGENLGEEWSKERPWSRTDLGVSEERKGDRRVYSTGPGARVKDECGEWGLSQTTHGHGEQFGWHSPCNVVPRVLEAVGWHEGILGFGALAGVAHWLEQHLRLDSRSGHISTLWVRFSVRCLAQATNQHFSLFLSLRFGRPPWMLCGEWTMRVQV